MRRELIRFVLSELAARFPGRVPEWALDAASGVLDDLLTHSPRLSAATRLEIQQRLDDALRGEVGE